MKLNRAIDISTYTLVAVEKVRVRQDTIKASYFRVYIIYIYIYTRHFFPHILQLLSRIRRKKNHENCTVYSLLYYTTTVQSPTLVYTSPFIQIHISLSDLGLFQNRSNNDMPLAVNEVQINPLAI